MSKHYNSCYGLHLKQFVDMKRTLGFKYKLSLSFHIK